MKGKFETAAFFGDAYLYRPAHPRGCCVIEGGGEDVLRGAAQEYAELGERFSARAEEEMRLAIGDVRRESDEAQNKAIREMELVSHAAVDAVARAAQNMAREADELSVAVERASRAILDATDRIAGDSAK